MCVFVCVCVVCVCDTTNQNRIIYGKRTAADYFSLYSSHCPGPRLAAKYSKQKIRQKYQMLEF